MPEASNDLSRIGAELLASTEAIHAAIQALFAGRVDGAEAA